MSRGLGTMQRLMLFRLADHEVRVAEAAAERQRPYRPPDRWSLRALTYSTFYDQITARQRVAHDGWQDTLRRWKAGDESAAERVKWVVNIHAICRAPAPLDETDFEPKRPDNYVLQRFNPSRAILGLEKHGFVLRDHYRRHDNLALTVEGFAEARRLRGVREPEIINLDRIQANWRPARGFRLGLRDWELRHDDDPPRDGGRLVVSKFAHGRTP